MLEFFRPFIFNPPKIKDLAWPRMLQFFCSPADPLLSRTGKDEISAAIQSGEDIFSPANYHARWGDLFMARLDRESLDRARRMRREMTRAEVILWTRLKGRQLLGYQFNRQKKIGPYYPDFSCAAARLIVEVDGATHSTAEERAYDASRTAFLEREGWTVLRIWNDDVYRNETGVVETILRYLPH
jgi:very-short-patch-repair endonuclease